MVASPAPQPADPARRRAVARRVGARGTRWLPLCALWLAVRPVGRLSLPAGNDTTAPDCLLSRDYSRFRRCRPCRRVAPASLAEPRRDLNGCDSAGADLAIDRRSD